MGFRASLAASVVLGAALLGGCASPGEETDEATAVQIRGLIRDLGTTKGSEKENTILTLGQILRARSVPFLLEALEGDSNPDVRAGCAHALGIAQDGAAVEPLFRALGDSNDGVRYTAAYNLGLFRDARGIPALIESLSSANVMHRYSGHQSLAFLTKRDFGFDARAEPEAREAAARRWEEWFRDIQASGGEGASLLPTEGAIRR